MSLSAAVWVQFVTQSFHQHLLMETVSSSMISNIK